MTSLSALSHDMTCVKSRADFNQLVYSLLDNEPVMSYIAETMSNNNKRLKETIMTERDVKQRNPDVEQISDQELISDADYQDALRADPLTARQAMQEERQELIQARKNRESEAEAEEAAKRKAEEEAKDTELERLRELEKEQS